MRKSKSPAQARFYEPLRKTQCGHTPYFGHFDIRECSKLTNAHAFWIPSTKITLESPTTIMIKTHDTEGAGRNAHFAADAERVLDYHPVVLVPINGLHRAGKNAGRIRALKAYSREIELPYPLIHDDANAAVCRIVQARALKRTCHFTVLTAIALEEIKLN